MIDNRTIRLRSMAGAVFLIAGVLHCLYYVTGMLGGWEKDLWNMIQVIAGLGIAFLGAVIWRIRRRTFTGRARTAVVLFRTILIIGIVLFVGGEVLIWQAGRRSEPQQTDYVLILGARVKGDVVTLSLKERLDQGLAYLKRYPGTPVILSGGKGSGEDLSEAEAMKNYLAEHGVPQNLLLLEDRSRDTYENMKYSRELLEARGVHPESVTVTLITNDFHMLRSKLLADRVGLHVRGYSSTTPPYTLPRMLTREFAALFKSWAFDR